MTAHYCCLTWKKKIINCRSVFYRANVTMKKCQTPQTLVQNKAPDVQPSSLLSLQLPAVGSELQTPQSFLFWAGKEGNTHLTATEARSNCSMLRYGFLQLWRSLLSVKVELNPPPFLLFGGIEAQDPQAWWCHVLAALYMEQRNDLRYETQVVLRPICTHQSGSQRQSFRAPTKQMSARCTGAGVGSPWLWGQA